MIVHVNQVHVATHEVPAKSWLTAHEKNGFADIAFSCIAHEEGWYGSVYQNPAKRNSICLEGGVGSAGRLEDVSVPHG